MKRHPIALITTHLLNTHSMSEALRELALTLAWGLLYAALLILPTLITVPLHVNVVVTPTLVYVYAAAWLLTPMAIVLLLFHLLTNERGRKSLSTALIALALAYAIVAVIGAAMNMWRAIPSVLCNASNYQCLLQ